VHLPCRRDIATTTLPLLLLSEMILAVRLVEPVPA
jgi:hypothetical protein